MNWDSLSMVRVNFDGWNQKIDMGGASKLRAWARRQRPAYVKVVVAGRDNTYLKGAIEISGTISFERGRELAAEAQTLLNKLTIEAKARLYGEAPVQA